MAQNRSLEYGESRSTNKINQKFVGILPPGPFQGYNVALQSGHTVRVQNTDDPTKENVLLTPQGVRISEAAGWSTDILVPSAAGTYGIICRYAHGAPSHGVDATYLCVANAALVADTDTVLAAVYILGTEPAIIPANITEGARYRAGGAEIPISRVNGTDYVLGAKILEMHVAENIAPASLVAGCSLGFLATGGPFTWSLGFVWPGDAAPTASNGAFVRMWFEVDNWTADGNLLINQLWETPPATEPGGLVQKGENTTKDMTGSGTGEYWYIDMPVPATMQRIGWPIRLGLMRIGIGDPADTYNADIIIRDVVLYYKRQTVGGSTAGVF
jgi:hypothetical protein